MCGGSYGVVNVLPVYDIGKVHVKFTKAFNIKADREYILYIYII